MCRFMPRAWMHFLHQTSPVINSAYRWQPYVLWGSSKLRLLVQTSHLVLFVCSICNHKLKRAMRSGLVSSTKTGATSERSCRSSWTSSSRPQQCDWVSPLSSPEQPLDRKTNEGTGAKEEHLGVIQVYKTLLIGCSPSCTVPAWPVPEQFVPQV